MTLPASLLSLDRRVAVITGGAGGIGRATADLLATAGARIAVIDVNAEAMASLPPAYDRYHADIGVEADVAAAIGAIAERSGRIDILVNNAGFGARGPTEELTLERWQNVMAVTMTGSFLCAREAGRHMLAAGKGAIVNIASIMGMVGNAIYPNLAYHTAKGAVVNMTRGLAVEWAPRGVRINAIAPTFVETQLTLPLLSDNATRSAILDATPMGKLAQPEDIAEAVLFLVSDMAAMVTGQILAVDGGWLAR